MGEHFLCAARVRQNRSGKNCESHLCLPHLYGVAIPGYTKVVGSSDRAKTKLGKAFEGTNHSEEQLRVIIDTIPAFVWGAKPDGSIEFLNKRGLAYTGFSLEQPGLRPGIKAHLEARTPTSASGGSCLRPTDT
jgi:PAS domain-containing protein